MSTTQKKLRVGSQITIPAGQRVWNRNGITSSTQQLRTTTVTVRQVEQTPSGKTRIHWASQGYLLNTLI